MKDFVFKPRNQIIFLFVLVSSVLLVSIVIGLEKFFQATSDELVESWYASELVSIQQGNSLSSVTKLQRSLTKSKILKGILVLDQNARILITFGETDQKVHQSRSSNESLKTIKMGFFKYFYTFSSNNLSFYIFTGAPFLIYLLAAILMYSLTLIGGLAFFIRKTSIKEEGLRNEISMQQVRLELQFQQKIVELSKRLAHDIRSPLSAINTLAHTTRGLSSEDTSLLKIASENINKIADDLLDRTRQEISSHLDQSSVISPSEKSVAAKSYEYHSSTVIKRVCEEAIALKKLEIPPGLSIQLSLYDNAHGSPLVSMEPTALGRILSNLLNNSIESIAGKGFISVTLENDGNSFIIEVRDSGKGISEETIEKIFNAPTSEGKARGNGIGLYSSIEQVKSWGGTTEITSQRSMGTKIKIALKSQDIR